MRTIRGESNGISVIVGALMLTLIVVTAAVSFAVFSAQKQESIQEAELAELSRSLEKLEITGISANNSLIYEPDYNDSYDNLKFVGFDLFSQHQDNSKITMITLNNYLLRNFTINRPDEEDQDEFWEMNDNGTYVNGARKNVDIDANEHVILKIDTSASFPKWNEDNIEINDPLEIRIVTYLGNTFSTLFIPPNPLINIDTETQFQNGESIEKIVLDGSGSTAEGASNFIQSWEWEIFYPDPVENESLPNPQHFIYRDSPINGYDILHLDPDGDGINANVEKSNFINISYNGTIGWWNANWSYRKSISLNQNLGSGSDYIPIVVDFISDKFFENINNNRSDIRFIYNDNLLDYEIELFDIDTNHFTAWVRVPKNASSFHLYYSNPSASPQSGTIWDTNYRMILHLNESNGNHIDSVGSYNAVPQGDIFQGITGKIGFADEFDGVDDYLNIANGMNLFNGLDEWTFECWIMPFAPDKEYNINPIIGKNNMLDYDVLLALTKTGSIKFGEYFTGEEITTTIDLSNIRSGQWNHLVIIREENEYRIFANGELNIYQIDNDPEQNPTDTDLDIGRYFMDQTFFNGKIDEIRISNISRDQDYVDLQYQSQLNPSYFCSIGPQIGYQTSNNKILFAVDSYDEIFAFLDEDGDNTVNAEDIVYFDPDFNGNANPDSSQQIKGGYLSRAITSPIPELYSFEYNNSWYYQDGDIIIDDDFDDDGSIAEPTPSDNAGNYAVDAHDNPFIFRDEDSNGKYDNGERIIYYDPDFNGIDANPDSTFADINCDSSQLVALDAIPSYELFVFEDTVDSGDQLFSGPIELIYGDVDNNGIETSKLGVRGGLFALDENGMDYTFYDENGNWQYDESELIISLNPNGKGGRAYPCNGDSAGLYAIDENGNAFIFKDSNLDWTYGVITSQIIDDDPAPFTNIQPAAPVAHIVGGKLTTDTGEDFIQKNGSKITPAFAYNDIEYSIYLTVTDNNGMIGEAKVTYKP